ncbi:MAG: hypothetical protein ACFFDT_30800, partial [Candidatus Hodarchaeota archaeon]
MNPDSDDTQEQLKKRKLLFDFWKDVPTIRLMDESFFTIMNQEVRSAILDILREGILQAIILRLPRKGEALPGTLYSISRLRRLIFS